MSVWSVPLPPRPYFGFRGHLKRLHAAGELESLLARIRRRLYPESLAVLAFYWLKTIQAAGHPRAWWKRIDGEIQDVLRAECLDEPAFDCLGAIRAWVQTNILGKRRVPERQERLRPPFRPDLSAEQLEPYLHRLINEWLPTEVARLLITGTGHARAHDRGIPALSAGMALERILVRERISPATLEMLLQPALLGPRRFYPAEIELFQDVVLHLLGRTSAAPLPATPATLLAAARTSALPGGYAKAVEAAVIVEGDRADELHVSIADGEAPIDSVVVTMDGRWWRPNDLRRRAGNLLVYQPCGRLRIDFTSDHARLTIPWPDADAHWPGAVRLPQRLDIFGREWRASAWERDAERTLLHLEFSRALKPMENPETAHAGFRRLRPAAVEMAWSEMERALKDCAAGKTTAPIDQLHRPDLIPLARAIHRLSGSLHRRVARNEEEIEAGLRAVRYLLQSLAPLYGRIPWRIVPARTRRALLKTNLDAESRALVAEVFDDIPVEFRRPVSQHVFSAAAGPAEASPHP